jgi:hypothetical protein
MTPSNPPREATLRSFSFANNPPDTPTRVRKDPTYRNTTVGFRTRAQCRCPR